MFKVIIILLGAFVCSAANANLPVRRLPTRVSIMKTTITRSPTGGFYVSVDVVCQIDGVVDLYDLRSPGGGSTSSNTVAECETEIEGVPAKMYVDVNVVLLHGRVFEGDPAADFRLTLVDLSSFEVASGFRRLHFTTRGISRDVSASSIVYAEESQVREWNYSLQLEVGP